MALFRAVSVLALGMSSYALYKTGALDPVIKQAVKTGTKVKQYKDETVSKAKEHYSNLMKKDEEEKNESDVISGELLTDDK